ncbi:hypothetical protein BDB01DRAFT_853717 [Pilobolus umbonatus]|nr:hypothetical protein BDB01DRAFT_853717 [Pilobolus umbonatus]
MSLHSYNSSIHNFSGSTASSRSELSNLDDVGLGAAEFFNTPPPAFADSPDSQPLQQQVDYISPIHYPLQQQGDVPFFFLPPPIFEEVPFSYEDMDMDMSPPPSPSRYPQFIDDPMEIDDPMDVDEWEVNLDYMEVDF